MDFDIGLNVTRSVGALGIISVQSDSDIHCDSKEVANLSRTEGTEKDIANKAAIYKQITKDRALIYKIPLH
jgi:hypothetical protein